MIGLGLASPPLTRAVSAGPRTSFPASQATPMVLRAELSPYGALDFGENVFSEQDLSGDGHTLVAGYDGGAIVCRFTNGAWKTCVQLMPVSNPSHNGQPEHVAISADGATALVGDEVFRLTQGRWRLQSELGGGYDGLDEVALSGDGNTAMYGAGSKTVDGRDEAGAAEVFRFVNGKWGPAAELGLGRTAYAWEQFGGQAMALDDNGRVAIVGDSLRVVHGRQYGGAAYVFRFAAGRWHGPAELSLGARAATGDEFGTSVALSGDGATALIGAPERTPASSKTARCTPQTSGYCGSQGTAEVFHFDGSRWSPPTELSLGARAAVDDYFGWSVALSRNGRVAMAGTLRGNDNQNSQTVDGAEVFESSAAGWSAPVGIGTTTTDGGLPATHGLSSDGTTAVIGVADERSNRGRLDLFSADPTAVAVSLNASSPYGANLPLTALRPDNPSIAYNPPGQARNVTGSLSCTTDATSSSAAHFYTLSNCTGLSDPGHIIVYDYVNSGYTIRPAAVKLSYTGPATMKHGATATLSARLTSAVTGRPIRNRVLGFQIGAYPKPGGPVAGCDSTSPGGSKTNADGVGSCVIHNVQATTSPNVVLVDFAGDPATKRYFGGARIEIPVTIVK